MGDDEGTPIDIDDDIKKRYNGTPTVVKTTKQVITRGDDGVTHNVEEKVQNLGTGEVTYSTQEHKVRNLHTFFYLCLIERGCDTLVLERIKFPWLMRTEMCQTK